MQQATTLPAITKRRIISDVETVEREAQYLLVICEEKVVELQNAAGALSIIAVIGPTFSKEHGHIKKALLCEIGIGRARPYRVAEIPKELQEMYHKKSTKSRRKVFHFSKEQYLLVAPKIFELFQFIANDRISSWECNHENPFVIKVNGRRWSKTNKRYYDRTVSLNAESGIRFSVCRDDTYLVHDIIWAELFGNDVLAKQLKGLSAMLGFPLAHYRKLKTKKPLHKLPRYHTIKAHVEKHGMPNYLKIHMLRHFLRKPELQYFREDLKEMFGWDGRESIHEMRAQMAFPDPQSRLKHIRLRLTHDHSNDSIHVFEVFYSHQMEKKRIETEDIPF